MPQIKFSHIYRKLLGENGEPISGAHLIYVGIVNLEELHERFIDYDTDYGKYKLPKKGKYLMLLFTNTRHNKLFTTLRRHTEQKESYYRNRVGECFEIVVKEDSDATSSKPAPK